MWLPLVCFSREDFLFSWFVPIQAPFESPLESGLRRLYHLPFEYLQDIEVVEGLAGSDVDLVELLKDVGEGLLNPSHVNICKMFGEQIFVGRSYIYCGSCGLERI